MYTFLFDNFLRRIEPERAHELARKSLAVARSTAVGRAIVHRVVGATDPRLKVHALGLEFTSPLGVAAGVDKDATWFEDLGALGFGFVEVGTVTARAQQGNPRPRLVRATDSRALVNRMGFPNPGAGAVAARLAEYRRRRADPATVVGVNVGKSMVVPVESADQDYRSSVRLLAPVSDYVVLNVSSPNTPGLRTMQSADRLRSLVFAVREELRALGRRVPLMVKIAPDLDDDQLDAVASVALEVELDGIVAVNTTADRSMLSESERAAVPFDEGGVSGRPLRARSVEVLRRLRTNAGPGLVLISVGGIEGADDAWERILAGATLVQVYTALVYEGPGWAARVNRELARRARDAGVSSIQELVGAGEVATPA